MFADETQMLQSSLSRLEKQLQMASLVEAKMVERNLTKLLEKMETRPTVSGEVDEILRQLLLQTFDKLRQRIENMQQELLLSHTQDSNSLLH